MNCESEIDFHTVGESNLPLKERTQAMEEWTSQANELLVKYKLNENLIPDIVANANVELREGFSKFSEILFENQVPFLIFSAGLSNTISEILRQQQGEVETNIRILSNKMRFDENGLAEGFTKPVIHSYIKERIGSQFSDVKKLIQGRFNVVLLGDAMTDIKMVSGLNRVDHVIKIGFLNHDEGELLPVFSAVYDIILTEDTDMEVPHALLKAILN